MKAFLNIESVFSSNEDRCTAHFKNIYLNPELMKEKIRAVLQNKLTENEIQGKRIFIKPNWVNHNTVEDDEWCLRTHDEFLLAALEIVLELNPQSILIGDSPIQGCSWEKVVTKDLVDRVLSLSKKYQAPVDVRDFRRVTFQPFKNNPLRERIPLSNYLIFDLGKESILEPVSRPNNSRFRITNYNPNRLSEAHGLGFHKYCVTKEIFEADLVISLPKVKTHQKTGISAALKNIVGFIGDKESLPHHRMGGTDFGGDCYPGRNVLRYGAELSLDFANRRQGKFLYWLGYGMSCFLWKISLPGMHHQIAAGWYGNDTTWRMVLDLNKIFIFGKADGTLAQVPQRRLLSLSDGIIGGQGNGPLKPDPLPLGVIAFSDHSGLHDIAMAILMGFDNEKIPLTRKQVVLSENVERIITWNDREILLSELKNHAVKTLPPSGWIGYLN